MPMKKAAYDAEGMLRRAGIRPTMVRTAVVECTAAKGEAVPAVEILAALREERKVDKVTLYRTLDLLVERGVLLKSEAGDRSFRYCLSGNENRHHCHFHCRKCGRSYCIPEEPQHLCAHSRSASLPGTLECVEVRLDGVCKGCCGEA